MKDALKKTAVLFLFFVLTQYIQASEENKKGQKAYSSSTSFSFLHTSGNTNDWSLGLDTEQNWKSKKNHFQFMGSVIYSESEGARDTEFFSSHFLNRFEFKSKAYLLGFGKLERNVLSGYNYRFAITAGAGYFWRKSEKFTLSSEVAFGWSVENNIEKDTDSDFSLSFPSLLISNSLQLALSSNSELAHQDIILFNLENFEDYRVSSLTAVSITISKIFSFKVSYQLKYSRSPVPGFKSTDQYLLSSLVLNF